MSIRSRLGAIVDSVADRVIERADASLRKRLQESRNAHLVVGGVLAAEDLRTFQFPQFYLRLLREWARETRVDVEVVKPLESTSVPVGVRYATYLAELERRMPMAPMQLVREVGAYADSVLARTDPIAYSGWAADVGLHFQIGSSLGRKGRLLHALVRFAQPMSYLELGTAYGMSALIAARTLETLGVQWSVTTVAIATAMLRPRFDRGIDCRIGWSQDSRARLAAEGCSLTSCFTMRHTASMTTSRILRSLEPMMRSGALCLIDDIRWDDARFSGKPARCYEGWRQIASHSRVRAAAELDGDLGVVLLS